MTEFLQKIFDTIDLESLPSFFGDLIQKFFSILSDLVYSFFEKSSDFFVSYGSKFFVFFADKFTFDNPDLILYFLGALICIFIFKRIWQLICNFF